MTKFPFQLLIKSTSSKNEEESLLCTGLLRVIPGRRQIYDARWNDKNVVAKVFSHKISARRHLRRELQGLNQLQKRGLSSPKPLFFGQTEDGQWIVILEKIVNSATVLDVLDEITDKLKELDLLIRVCRELAKQHGKGVLQKDLHLGNFLLAGDRIYALDAGRMQFFSRQVPRKKSISQLALFVRYLPAGDIESAGEICKEYFKARGWHFGKSDEALLQKQLAVHRKRGIKGGLKKCLRTSKRYLKIKAQRYVAVFDRSFCREAEPLDFIEHIDALMDEGQILKNGNTCYVSHLMWDGKDVVVKRYNHKGFVHSLRHTIKRSRARRGWLYAHRLGMLDISTPKPLAYIEQRKGLLIWKSYLATQYIEGQSLYDFLRDDNVAQERRSTTTQQVKNMLDKLAKYRITHGDLKHSNILVTKTGPVLTDLDGMKVHKWHLMCKARQAKDLERLANQGSIKPMSDRVKVIQAIIDRTKAKTYLEIGVEGGHTFLKIHAKKKIGVDPQFRIGRKKKLKKIFKNLSNVFNEYYQMESDTFFRTKSYRLARHGVDVALIDGLHTYEQSLRDVQSTLKFLNPKGFIVVHDCNPPCEVAAYTASSCKQAESLSPDGWTGQWCGDVWKTICYLRTAQEDLRIFVLDCDYGLGIITRGTPENILSYSKDDIDNLTYDNLNENRTGILNLKNSKFFEEFIKSI